MKFSHFFIRRPIFAAVLSIITVVLGLVALFTLPVAQYPEVTPPTVFVMANYPGASADTVASTVATPLEQEINGVEGMLYMSSSCSSDGQLRIGVTFKTGTDLNMAQVQVQNRVSVALPRLPEEVRRLGVTTMKRSPSITLMVHLISPNRKYDDLYMGNYAFLHVKDKLARLPGVGDVRIFGVSEYSIRIWIDPNKASTRNLTAPEIVTAIREQNIQVAAGVFGQQPQPTGNLFQLTAQTKGRFSTPEEFGDIILKTGPQGQVTRLRDVARIELGANDYNIRDYLDGEAAVVLAVFQLPGSNAIETRDAVADAMKEMKQDFPPGLDYKIVFDTTVFIRESIHAVIKTLLEAILLVVIVVVLFLQNWRASLIPLLAVPVSLIGTFAVMAMMGFSLNNLSLFGLVLAIGIVVDDAIVVVENVERNIALGLPPVEATRKAMTEVSSAVVAIGLVLAAVFIPTAFLSGLTGQFYRQFALTIAVSTLISAFNSLTLSPALAALLLQPHHEEKDFVGRLIHWTVGWIFRGFNRLFEASRNGYVAALGRVLRHCGIALFLYAALLALTWFGFNRVPTGFVPPQDKGYLIAYVQLPDGASIERTRAVSERMSQIMREVPGVANVVEIVGLSFVTLGSQANAASFFIPLKPFRERVKDGLTGNIIAGKLRARLSSIQEGFIGVFGPPPVDGLGLVGGFKLQVQDRNQLGFQTLQAETYKLMAAANQDKRISGALSTFRASVPQVFLDVDRAKAKTMHVPLTTVWETLQIYLGSLYVNDFNAFGRPYRVTAQADASFRAKPEDVMNLKVRNDAGEMVPLGTIVKVRDITAPVSVVRYNMYPAAEITGATAPGVSTGEAIRVMNELADRMLLPGLGIEWTEISLLQIQAGNTAVFIFPLCVLMVFLVLAAQYESWSLPLAIILIVPMCLLFAIFGVWARDMDNSLFTQIGLVVLMGLACKNAILIVEFARQLQEAGRPRLEAAIEASRLRLRPILMTSLAFAFGVLPMMLSHGAGAEMRQSIGTAVFFGMLGVTFFGIFLTPVFYVVIRRVLERKKKIAGSEGLAGARPSGAAAALFVVGVAVAALLSGSIASSSPRPVDNKPNLILILADDLGYGDVGPFGSKLNRTPNLDRMAREGMRLTSFYACPVCTPSRAQFMTGCYAKRVSLPNVIFPACPIGLNTNEATLPKLLKQQGYATMAIGKWHLGDQREFLPTREGFDHYFGLPYSNDMGGGEEGPKAKKSAGTRAAPETNAIASELGVVRGRRPPLPLVRDEQVIETVSPAQQDKLTARYTEEAVNFIQAHWNGPFFLYFPHTAVHVPLHPGAKFRGQSHNGTYGDWVEELDGSIGQIFATLRKLKLEERTLVFFTSDNGPWLVQGTNGGVAGPLRGGKGSTWEGGVREPTVAWWPGKIAAGTSCDAVAANLDLLPTFVKLAGGAVPADRKIDGVDIWPLLTGSAKASSREAHYYFNGNRLEAVRSGPWKLAIRPQPEGRRGEKAITTATEKTRAPRLYNLADDIGETTDMAAQHPEIVLRLQELIAKMDADLGTNGLGPGVRPPGRVAKPQPLLLPGVKFIVEPPPPAPRTGKSLADLQIGDVLSRDEAPQVANRPLTISLEVEPQVRDGVILAHGGIATGYALHLRDGRLVFTVRENREPVSIVARDTPTGRFAIEARLDASGGMTLAINGQKVAEGKAPGLLAMQPRENFCLGFDDGQPVGEYPRDLRFPGKIEHVRVTTQ